MSGRQDLNRGACLRKINALIGKANTELKKKKPTAKAMSLVYVGTTGFEPATPQPPAECSTELSHVPILIDFKIRVKYSELQRESY